MARGIYTLNSAIKLCGVQGELIFSIYLVTDDVKNPTIICDGNLRWSYWKNHHVERGHFRIDRYPSRRVVRGEEYMSNPIGNNIKSPMMLDVRNNLCFRRTASLSTKQYFIHENSASYVVSINAFLTGGIFVNCITDVEIDHRQE